MANAERYAGQNRQALMLTEFGATSSAVDLHQLLSLADEHMTPWLEWMYCGCQDPTTAAVPRDQAIVYDPRRPPTGSNLATKTIAALVEPYPQAIAGTPRWWRFERGSRTFRLRYRHPCGERPPLVPGGVR